MLFLFRGGASQWDRSLTRREVRYEVRRDPPVRIKTLMLSASDGRVCTRGQPGLFAMYTRRQGDRSKKVDSLDCSVDSSQPPFFKLVLGRWQHVCSSDNSQAIVENDFQVGFKFKFKLVMIPSPLWILFQGRYSQAHGPEHTESQIPHVGTLGRTS